jgi:hypothetical protein
MMVDLEEEEDRVNGDDPIDLDDPHVIKGVLDFPTTIPAEKVLLGDGWLRRGDCATFISSAGAGKTVGSVQAAMAWGIGLPYFGIAPVKPLKVLLFSGEDDNVTLGQCREGLIEHGEAITGSKLGRDDLQILDEGFVTDFSREHVADGFHGRLRGHLKAGNFDLVIINPLLSYLGGDVVKEVSPWLRAGLLPILQEFDVASLVVHHTTRMAKDSWDNTDDVYSAIGGGEIANIPRAILTLRPTKDKELFVLKVGKRQTTGWKDDEGKFTTSYFVCRSDNPCRPAWIPVAYDEAMERLGSASGGNNRRKCEPVDVLAILEVGKISRAELLKALMRRCSCSQAIAKNALKTARGDESLGIHEWSEKNPKGGMDLVWFATPEHAPKG